MIACLLAAGCVSPDPGYVTLEPELPGTQPSDAPCPPCCLDVCDGPCRVACAYEDAGILGVRTCWTRACHPRDGGM